MKVLRAKQDYRGKIVVCPICQTESLIEDIDDIFYYGPHPYCTCPLCTNDIALPPPQTLPDAEALKLEKRYDRRGTT